MPHQFISTEPGRLGGTWFKQNGRRYCHWRYDAESSTLHAARGIVTRSRVVDMNGPLDTLMEELPRLALELAQSTPH